jgi:hypothetical protein
MKIAILTVGKRQNRNCGYAGLMLLVIAASAFAIASFAGALLYARAVKIEKENELIYRGLAYADAIKSYYNSGKGRKTYPMRLEDLLSDPRFSDKKHIRKLYIDPITKGDWNVIVGNDGSITGVAGRSKSKPIKIKDFPAKLKGFENAEHYSDWIFMCSNTLNNTVKHCINTGAILY